MRPATHRGGLDAAAGPARVTGRTSPRARLASHDRGLDTRALIVLIAGGATVLWGCFGDPSRPSSDRRGRPGPTAGPVRPSTPLTPCQDAARLDLLARAATSEAAVEALATAELRCPDAARRRRLLERLERWVEEAIRAGALDRATFLARVLNEIDPGPSRRRQLIQRLLDQHRLREARALLVDSGAHAEPLRAALARLEQELSARERPTRQPPAAKGVELARHRARALGELEDSERRPVRLRSGLQPIRAITGVAWDPRGTSYATISEDGLVRVWEAASQLLLRVLAVGHHGSSMSSLTIGPGGRHLATAGDGGVKLWSLDDGKLLRTATTQRGFARDVTFSPDGKLLAWQDGGDSVVLWDVHTGQMRRGFSVRGSEVTAHRFSGDGRTIATRFGHDIRVWELRTGKAVWTLPMDDRGWFALSLTADGRLLAASAENEVRLWDLRSGKLLGALGGHTQWVRCLQFSPDGSRLASGGMGFTSRSGEIPDTSVRIWDVGTLRQMHTLKGHSAEMSGLSFSPDGRLLASANHDGTVRLWDAREGRPMSRPEGWTYEVDAVAFGAEGRYLALAGGRARQNDPEDAVIGVWDLQQGILHRSLRGHTRRIRALSLSPGSRLLASGGDDSNLRIWDIATGSLLHAQRGHRSGIWAVAFDPSGQLVVSTGLFDQEYRIWDVQTGRQVREQSVRYRPKSVTFSPDGLSLLIATLYDLSIVDVTSGKARLTVGSTLFNNSIAISHDGRTVATGDVQGLIQLWEMGQGGLIGSLTGHRSAVDSMSFSADGRRLASASSDGNVKLWDPVLGRLVQDLPGHGGKVGALSFGASGRLLASGSADRTVKLWDRESGTLLATLVTTDTGEWLVFTPDGHVDASPLGRRLVMWESGQRLHQWPLAWERNHVPGLLARLVRGDASFRLAALQRLVEKAATVRKPASR